MEPLFVGSHRARAVATGFQRALLLAAFLFTVGRAHAADTCAPRAPATGSKTTRVAAGPQYGASWLWEALLGAEYRKLWTTPIEVEVLNLRGLTPVDKGGGRQTRRLTFEDKDGHKYRVRSVDKKSANVVPKSIPLADKVTEDQNSSFHPAGPLVAGPLAEAAGIRTVKRRLVVLPDDPALGKYRKDFAGMLGTIEEDPRPGRTPGFKEFSEIVEHEELFPRLDASPGDRIDARAFLKARLLDMLIGDWDRHKRQWDFGRRDGSPLWEPIPKDRDQAFAKFDGLVLAMVRFSAPDLRLQNFSSEYSPAIGLMWNSRDFDRRVLAALEEPVWKEVVAELQASLTDTVIHQAVCEMPTEYYRISGARLEMALKTRREKLSEVADDFYRTVSREVDILATAANEVASIERFPDGDLEIRLAAVEDESTPYFRRRFTPRTTREVRLYLGEGNDRVVSRGRGSGAPKLRIIGGNGRDVLDESAGGGTRFYDSGKDDRALPGPGTRADHRPWIEKLDENENRPLDWGKTRMIFPWAGYEPDVGLLLGAGARFQGYGFRALPYRYRHTVIGAYATGLPGKHFEYEGDFRRRSSRMYTLVTARVSETDVVRFYGFGNETTALLGSSDFYKVNQTYMVLAPAMVFPVGSAKLSVGAIAKHSNTHESEPRFITLAQPFGAEGFSQVGATAGAEFDTREPRNAPRRGILLRVAGTAYPSVLDADEAFGEAHTEAAAHLSLLKPLTLSLRVGGQRVWGRFPFHEAAFLGGTRSVRGLARQRYAGEASLFGNSELRLRMSGMPVGILALADAGRVFMPDETSDRWHVGFGGGLWFSFRDDRNVVSVTAAHAEGATRIYLKGSLAF
jgi:hypothetical protein